MNSIELKNVSKAFADKKVLNNISISIVEGEIFGLLGPSGAGKTTIMKILTGQSKATEGEALVFGINSVNITDEIYSKIGMVLDNSGLYTRLSCYDNLSMFCEIYGIEKSCIPVVLEKVGLTEAMDKSVSNLSKGMTQRLVLARAIMHKPKLLFLDEPTSGLDPATTLKIHELIFELQKEGTTIFITSHNMAEVTKLCNHVALLNEGEIVEYGEPKEICRKYNNKKMISILLKDGGKVNLTNDSSSAIKIAECFEKDMVESIHSSEPDLESVFIKLTGRELV